ncbi:hypothetical protein ABZ930_39040 [Streptomyces sp. NPDC046716]|uniref:hypothetical protein n=1 Tax=Streptomyces sp. NPDC046716 TaxID=3157093 RepID=UPI0033FC6A0A
MVARAHGGTGHGLSAPQIGGSTRWAGILGILPRSSGSGSGRLRGGDGLFSTHLAANTRAHQWFCGSPEVMSIALLLVDVGLAL